MKIGVPKEHVSGECRVASTPEVTKKLVSKGFAVLVEDGAGIGSHYSNAAYEEAGATIVDKETAFSSDIVVKVRKPTVEEVNLMREEATGIGFIESCEDDDVHQTIFTRNISYMAMEQVPRISRAQPMDALSSQSNIAGYRAVLEAAVHYGRFVPLMMTSAGSAKPARIVILGVGVAGLQAIATARRLGGDVFAYDVRPEVNEQIRSLGAKPIELDIGESGSGEGGYAKELSEEAKQKQQHLLAEELKKAHVIISTALIPCRPAPTLITEDVVNNMRDGSVIVDLAAANGGNCPLTKADEVIVHDGKIIIGHTNYPSMIAADASAFYARNIANLIEIMVDKTDDELVMKNFAEDEITETALVKAS
ncbi:MAG: Re/Si-specific NAD(P)(+) transhydrogenase subunit alpha [Gammaproteobacteria bacterium]|nr:Re/Si-specific NAD(P)(+) transhydrogenase subunit alpha [Gammaproteobacteria bacterium]NNJ91555.1 Re/Si-specific NAD(P)(+) transhydrogenase subunit alpha [Gammaproteobacteria bacterium]